MPVQEPTHQLWLLAKPQAEWPATNEDLVLDLSLAWLNGGQAFEKAGATNFADIGTSWKDVVGQAFVQKANRAKDNVARSAKTMADLGQLAEHFQTSVKSVKTEIADFVNQHAALFDSYKTLPAPQGLQKQQELVTETVNQAKNSLATWANYLHGVSTLATEVMAQAPLVQLPNGTPQDAAQWWSELTPEQKAWLAAHRSFEVGNLNGIPTADRDLANQYTLTRALTDPDPQVRANAEAAQTALNQAKESNPGVPVGLYAFDPNAFGKDGRVAVSVGDVDHADDVAVLTPGVETTGTSIPNLTRDATNIYKTASVDAGGRKEAAIAWIGYDAPSGNGIVNAAAPYASFDGAKLLAGDVTGIRAARLDGAQPHVTAIGHSYGSTTTASAASLDGLQADDIVLLGSPGAGDGNTTAADLLHPGHVYSGSASSDPLSYLGGLTLGPDPSTDSFGAIRFQAETPHTGIDAHNSYVLPNSESLSNIGKIVSGHGDQITHAPSRPWIDDVPEYDPDGHREPTYPPSYPGAH